MHQTLTNYEVEANTQLIIDHPIFGEDTKLDIYISGDIVNPNHSDDGRAVKMDYFAIEKINNQRYTEKINGSIENFITNNSVYLDALLDNFDAEINVRS
jgi:hypothetical protein